MPWRRLGVADRVHGCESRHAGAVDARSARPRAGSSGSPWPRSAGIEPDQGEVVVGAGCRVVLARWRLHGQPGAVHEHARLGGALDLHGDPEREAAGRAPVGVGGLAGRRRSGRPGRCTLSARLEEHEVGGALADRAVRLGRPGWIVASRPKAAQRSFACGVGDARPDPDRRVTARTSDATTTDADGSSLHEHLHVHGRTGSFSTLRHPVLACITCDGRTGLLDSRWATAPRRSAAPRRGRRAGSRMRSGRSRRSASRSGSGGRTPVARSTASGNLAGCAVARQTIGTSGSRRRARAAPMPTAVWGSTSIPVRSWRSRMISRVASSSMLAASKRGSRGTSTDPTPRKRASSVRRAGAVAAEELEQQAFVVRRHLDVHRRAERGHDPLRHQGAAVGPPGEDVVAVRRDHELVDRHAHPLGDPAGEDVAEVAGGHRERAAAQLDRGGDVVHDLGHHAGPVDGVHRRQLHPIPEGDVARSTP